LQAIAEKGGYMLWPPVRFSYSTQTSTCRHRHRRSRPPSPEQCKPVVEAAPHQCRDLSNWLGTDDQGRTSLRMIYGFRISSCFG
jgi:microcin C transport system permease protein